MRTLRLTFLLLALLAAQVSLAKIAWVVGSGAPLDAPAVAQSLEALLGEEITVIPSEEVSLIAWVNNPDLREQHKALWGELSALLVSPTAGDSPAMTLMALLAMQKSLPENICPILVGARKLRYQMRGLKTTEADLTLAHIAQEAGFRYAPLPRIWEQVYTDDFFYDGFYRAGVLPTGAAAENYIQAAALALTLRGASFTLKAMPGIQEDLAEKLADSICQGFKAAEDIEYAAKRLPTKKYPVRIGNTLNAVLYDGTFEHAIGAWLERLAAADKRTLKLHYTTETQFATGWPCLFRTTQTLGEMPKAAVYTRPAFKDNTGIEEQRYLNAILRRDGKRYGYLPFQLALADVIAQYPELPIYQDGLPTPPTAAMFAAMLWLEWTGTIVKPTDLTPEESAVMDIGLTTMLQMKTLKKEVNAILYRPGDTLTADFALWKKPTQTVEVGLDLLDGTVAPATLTFTPENATAWQSVTLTLPEKRPATLMWKTTTPPFAGQSAGVRHVDDPTRAAALPPPAETIELPLEALLYLPKEEIIIEELQEAFAPPAPTAQTPPAP